MYHCLFASSLLGTAIGGPKLGWVIVILSAGRGIGRGLLGYFMAFGVLAGHQRFCWGLC